MVNPVNNYSVNQATLNPFQKRIEDQIKNPGARDPQENAVATQARNENQRSETQPVAQAASREDGGSRQAATQQRGSLVDVTV
jgi:hypothetical protein